MYIKSICMMLTILLPSAAIAQSNTTSITDAASELNKRLAGFPVTKQRTISEKKTVCYSEPCFNKFLSTTPEPSGARCRECVEIEERRIENFSTPASVSSAEIQRLDDLSIQEELITSLPDKVIITSDDLINCSSVQYSAQRTLTQTIQTGFAVTVTKTTSAAKALQGSLSIKLPGDTTIGGSSTFTAQIQTANATQESRSETTNQSQTISASVPAKTKLKIEYRTLVRKLRLPFSAKMIADGQLEPNLSNLFKASDLLPDPSLRTFPFEGYITVEAATAGKVTQSQYEPTVADCQGTTPSEEIRIRSTTTSLGSNEKSSVVTFKAALPGTRPSSNIINKSIFAKDLLSYPGAWCQTQACNLPLDGYRKVCYRDANLYCNDCRDEPDSVCAPSLSGSIQSK